MTQPSWGKWGTWEETESYLGKVIGEVVGADAVELGSIRRWMEPKEFDCDLHTSADAAREAVVFDDLAALGRALAKRRG